MRNPIYNVIWADDEYISLKKDNTIRMYLDKSNIEVLRFVSTSDDLRLALERFYDKVDAVVIDGNFARQGDINNEDDCIDISGLVHTISFIDTFNQKREIPFFLYTGKKSKILELCKQFKMLSYFEDTRDRIYQKGELEELTEAIINTVDHIHSIENEVNRKYAAVLKLASHIKGDPDNHNEHTKELLYQFLLDEARDVKYDKALSMFANLRIILEQIAYNCRMLNIVPNSINTLNYFANFWNYKDPKYRYVLSHFPASENIMPPVLASLIKPFVDLLQDGSHGKNDLELKVCDYVASTQTPFIFRSALQFVLNMIYWFDDVKKLSIPEFYVKNPYFAIRKEFNERTNRLEFRYKEFWFDRTCMPTDHEVGKLIKILTKNNKTITAFEIIEDD